LHHIDELVADLVSGGTKTAKGRTRRPWGADAESKVAQTIAMLLADAERQGLVARGDPYSPAVLSRYWRETVKAAGLRHIKLHAARHTCATLMHLDGVPVTVIAAWIGHKDASLTLRLYGHSHEDALRAAAATLNRVTLK
jgi:integrase